MPLLVVPENIARWQCPVPFEPRRGAGAGTAPTRKDRPVRRDRRRRSVRCKGDRLPTRLTFGKTSTPQRYETPDIEADAHTGGCDRPGALLWTHAHTGGEPLVRAARGPVFVLLGASVCREPRRQGKGWAMKSSRGFRSHAALASRPPCRDRGARAGRLRRNGHHDQHLAVCYAQRGGRVAVGDARRRREWRTRSGVRACVEVQDGGCRPLLAGRRRGGRCYRQCRWLSLRGRQLKRPTEMEVPDRRCDRLRAGRRRRSGLLPQQ